METTLNLERIADLIYFSCHSYSRVKDIFKDNQALYNLAEKWGKKYLEAEITLVNNPDYRTWLKDDAHIAELYEDFKNFTECK